MGAIITPFVSVVNTIMIPFLLGGFLYYLTNPIVIFLEKECKINRIIGILLTLCVLIGSLVIGVVYLLPILINQLSSLINSSQGIYGRLQDLVIELSKYPAFQELDIQQTIQQLNLSYIDILQNILNSVTNSVGSVLSALVTTVLIIIMTPVFLVYFLLDGHKFLPMLERSILKNDRLGANVLSALLIPNVDAGLAASLELKPHHRSLGIVTSDCDDVTYVALDEATKAADVEVVYARSMYAGAGNASTKLAGEVIGILAGPNPEEVRSGLDVVVYEIENGASFYSANDDDSIPYFAHCISRAGSYLSEGANAEEGTAIAYLIAPPAEAMVALDAALKAADVSVGAFYGPPSETNFAGGLLIGSQSACRAACDAFAQTVQSIADNPKSY